MSKQDILGPLKGLDRALDGFDEYLTMGQKLLAQVAEAIWEAYEQEGDAANAMAESIPGENHDAEIISCQPIPLERGKLIYPLGRFRHASPWELKRIVEVEKQLGYIRQRLNLLADLKDVMDSRKNFQREIDHAIARLEAEAERMIRVN